MIDKITLIKNNLPNAEKLQIIRNNGLQSFYNESTNTEIFDNAKVKNLTGGILIKIYGDKLKIEGSIHKYFNFLQYRTLENYTIFTMTDFLKTIETLFKNFGLGSINGFLVLNYEIGLNVLIKDSEPLEYLKKAQSIGNIDGTQKKLYINPKYKGETFLTTQMHKDNTLIFRMYDKNHERSDKGKKNKIPNCIRIETLRTRQKKLSFFDFCKPANLSLLQYRFFKEWNLLNFDKEILAPTGTHQTKKDLAKKILLNGTNATISELEERRNQITPKIYRTSKNFVKYWENYKLNFSLIPCEIAPKWAICYNSAIQLVTETQNKI